MRFFSQALCVFCAAVSLSVSAERVECQAPANIRRISPASRTLPLTEFYDTADPLPAGKPGELIRFEPFDEYHLSSDFSVFRMLYHSRSPNGKDVAVSGVVIVPEGSSPAGGWPVIAWAHDFTGSARACAPSLLKNLNEGPLLSMYVKAGYAVVASDYAGLGTNTAYAALDMRSNAVDVINSIPAARAAVPELGSRWVVAGYSQGGLVSVGVSEAQSEIADQNYLGALAISGIANPLDLYLHVAEGPSHALLLHLAAGIKAVFPNFRVDEMLAEKALPFYSQIQRSCDTSLGQSLASGEMMKPGWQNNRYVKDFFARNASGSSTARGPLLLISGGDDPDVPLSLTSAAVVRLCAHKDRVLSIQYSGLNASSVIGNSAAEQISWLRARFAGTPAPGNCP